MRAAGRFVTAARTAILIAALYRLARERPPVILPEEIGAPIGAPHPPTLGKFASAPAADAFCRGWRVGRSRLADESDARAAFDPLIEVDGRHRLRDGKTLHILNACGADCGAVVAGRDAHRDDVPAIDARECDHRLHALAARAARRQQRFRGFDEAHRERFELRQLERRFTKAVEPDEQPAALRRVGEIRVRFESLAETLPVEFEREHRSVASARIDRAQHVLREPRRLRDRC